jgi:hypothetical protein
MTERPSQDRSHGNTVAAWVTVTLIMLASVVCTVSLLMHNWIGFWIGTALVPIAVLVGQVLKGLGFGAMPGWETEQPVDADPTTGGADLGTRSVPPRDR